MTIDDVPLRLRKYALTKTGLVNAAVQRLDACTLDELQVRVLCRAVDISEASFFNYFPKKSDLLVAFVQLWTIDVAWHALVQEPRPATAREAIGRVFRFAGEQAAKHPGVMAEVLAAQARMVEPPVVADVTLAERLAAFPGRQGIENVPARGLDSLLPELLRRAVKQKELPPHTDVRSAFLGLTAIFFGVPAVLRRIDPRLVGPAYQQQLSIYWDGLRAAPRSSRRRKAR